MKAVRRLTLPESIWFKWNQLPMLALANSSYGRERLWMGNEFPLSEKIVSIRPSSYTIRTGEAEHVSVFYTYNKFGEAIRHWEEGEFSDLFRFYQKQARDEAEALHGAYRKQYGIGVAGGLLAWATVTDFFTAPHPETGLNSVDGYVARQIASETWATIVAGAGNISNDTSNDFMLLVRASATIDEIDRNRRMIAVFDTGDTLSGDTVTAADYIPTVSILSDGLIGDTSDNSKMVIVEANPATNEALVNADYGAFGSVDFGRSGNQSTLASDVAETIVLNDSGRSHVKTGAGEATGFGTMWAWDFDEPSIGDIFSNGATWSSGAAQFIICHSADTVDTDRDPLLRVTHVGPVPSPQYGQIIMQPTGPNYALRLSETSDNFPQYGQVIKASPKPLYAQEFLKEADDDQHGQRIVRD